MIRLGLTGSIAMGKSTTAGLFRDEGVAVHDSDEAVHRLYGPDGVASRRIAEIAPQAVGPEGVDRAVLKEAIAQDPQLLSKLEEIVHPLVAADRRAFERAAAARGEKLALFDIPLLFETMMANELDKIIVVTAGPDIQRARALARPGMTEAHFDRILARQVPDAEKRARADFVIDTGQGIEAARAQVRDILKKMRREAQGRNDNRQN